MAKLINDCQPGDTYGEWTVIGPAPLKGNSKLRRVFCRCSCGTEKSVLAISLRSGISKSCVKGHPKELHRKDCVMGAVFGEWVVIDEIRDDPRNRAAPRERGVMCRCSCGVERFVRVGNLRRGGSSSCGHDTCVSHGATRYAEIGSEYRKIYTTWQSMRERCQNNMHRNYHRYGGRGITVCDEWDDFLVFVADMGPRPPGTSLERIDNDGGYSPSNCKWATKVEQCNNRYNTTFVEYDGRKVAMTILAREHGLNPRLVRERLRLGWTITQALKGSKKL